MLDPDNRHLLVDALKPPPGMSLDVAVGTTFTLDLQALLLAPVSFAFFGSEAAGAGESQDPLALLEAVRRHADRITVYTQAGCISVPRTLQPVLAWLEDAVVPVRPPKPGRLFHPKIWALRFVDDQGHFTHRLLVASRNLTFDTSWDTIVRLDGIEQDTPQDTNEPLTAFLRWLPKGAVQAPKPDRQEQLTDLASTIGSVSWELPAGARSVRFWPLGTPGDEVPDLAADRALVISPFLSANALSRLASKGDEHHLISRADALDGVGAGSLGGFVQTSVLDSDTIQPDIDDGPSDHDEPHAAETERAGTLLQGLHAKLYLLERGGTTHLITGSANATDAAFHGNVEFLVELKGRTADWGIDATLAASGHKASLQDMIRPYSPKSDEPTEPSAVDQLTYRLDAYVRDVAAMAFRVTIEAEGDEFRLHVGTDDVVPFFAPDVEMSVRPASIGAGAGLGVNLAPDVRVDHQAGAVTLAGISSFLVVRATGRCEGQLVHAEALINARLVGAPTDRMERLLTAQLKSSDDLVRYLLFLLHELSDDAQLDSLMAQYGVGGSSWRTAGEIPLFETLLRALAHGGPALDRVADRLDDICATEDGRRLLPPGFDEIWEPINQVRQELGR